MITQQELKELLNYDQETGIFTWIKISPHLSRLIGTKAGTKRKDGYYRVYIDNKRYYLHRLAWLYVHGELPKTIDHVNQNPSDNRIDNLRNVTQLENMRNRKLSSNNTSGITGVTYNKSRKKWVAQININDKGYFLGHFDTAEDAKTKRIATSKTLGFTELHG